MPNNLGRPDQIIRVILGVGLLALPSLAGLAGWGARGSYGVGAVLIGTAAFSFCPIYAALGISTRSRKSTP